MKSTTSQCVVAEFGFYPLLLDIESGPVKVSTLPKLDDRVREVHGSDTVEKEWYYSPTEKILHVLADRVQVCPYPARVFCLPKTHQISHSNATDIRHVEFLVWVLSFFVGMRLTTTEAGFADATPIKPHKLTDFTVKKHNMSHVLLLGNKFWLNNNSEISKLFISAVHTLFISCNPQFVKLRFESFIFAYIALDACLTLSIKKGITLNSPKKNFIEKICEKYGIHCPQWCKDIKELRNLSLHQGLHLGEPLGFSVSSYQDKLGQHLPYNLPLSMQNLVCRMLVAIIGVNDKKYIRSSCEGRSRHSLKFDSDMEGQYT